MHLVTSFFPKNYCNFVNYICHNTTDISPKTLKTFLEIVQLTVAISKFQNPQRRGVFQFLKNNSTVSGSHCMLKCQDARRCRQSKKRISKFETESRNVNPPDTGTVVHLLGTAVAFLSYTSFEEEPFEPLHMV